MRLSDGGLRLRELRPADIDTALGWYQDPYVLRMSEGPAAQPFDRRRVERMYEVLGSTGELYMIEVPEGDVWRAIGDATLARDTLPIVIGESRYRGKGIGGRVLDLLIGRARELGWSCLEVKHVYAYNEASRRLFLSRCFVQMGTGVEGRDTAYGRYRLDLRAVPSGGTRR